MGPYPLIVDDTTYQSETADEHFTDNKQQQCCGRMFGLNHACSRETADS